MDTYKYVIGLDFGSDSVRSVIVNVQTGEEVASVVSYYASWKEGKYCNAPANQFRQHPQDYIDSMTVVITDALDKVGDEVRKNVIGIGVDTTGSTPCPVDKEGVPLALLPDFRENPNAMFHLWKDHTSIKEAEEINALCQKWDINYIQYVGGIYSSEWFWAKILHTTRQDPTIRQHAYTWVEHCDWIPYLLTGNKDVTTMKRSRCSAGHKALWHEKFDGLPSNDFLSALDPLLDGMRERMFTETYTSDVSAGTLSEEWAGKLGLSTDVEIAVGAFDAHMGAVGGQIKPYYLSKVIGTSTCDIMVAPMEGEEKLVAGICGQVDGSVIPGLLGLEAGQSAFGDIYAWFKRVISWPLHNAKGILTDKQIQDIEDAIIPQLAAQAEEVDPATSTVLALDWMNGRRTPDANQTLKGVISGINLGTSAPMIFRALVEATCFGSRKIAERFQNEGVPIEGVIALGGVSKKSAFVMQTLANIMNKPIQVGTSEQTCALGASMFAAVVAGVYENVDQAMDAMGAGFDKTYTPEPEMVAVYETLYQKYSEMAELLEPFMMKHK